MELGSTNWKEQFAEAVLVGGSWSEMAKARYYMLDEPRKTSDHHTSWSVGRETMVVCLSAADFFLSGHGLTYDSQASNTEMIMHIVAMPWKLLFAVVPPVDFLQVMDNAQMLTMREASRLGVEFVKSFRFVPRLRTVVVLRVASPPGIASPDFGEPLGFSPVSSFLASPWVLAWTLVSAVSFSRKRPPLCLLPRDAPGQPCGSEVAGARQ
eukprot:6359952-Amphidinium_carterae.1